MPTNSVKHGASGSPRAGRAPHPTTRHHLAERVSALRGPGWTKRFGVKSASKGPKMCPLLLLTTILHPTPSHPKESSWLWPQPWTCCSTVPLAGEGLRKAERKANSPKVPGPPLGVWGELRGAAAALAPLRTAPLCPCPLPTLRHFPVVAPPLPTHSQLSLQPLPASLSSWRPGGSGCSPRRGCSFSLPQAPNPGSCSRSPSPAPAGGPQPAGTR